MEAISWWRAVPLVRDWIICPGDHPRGEHAMRGPSTSAGRGYPTAAVARMRAVRLGLPVGAVRPRDQSGSIVSAPEYVQTATVSRCVIPGCGALAVDRAVVSGNAVATHPDDHTVPVWHADACDVHGWEVLKAARSGPMVAAPYCEPEGAYPLRWRWEDAGADLARLRRRARYVTHRVYRVTVTGRLCLPVSTVHLDGTVEIYTIMRDGAVYRDGRIWTSSDVEEVIPHA